MGTNPVKDKHPIQEGVEMPLVLLDGIPAPSPPLNLPVAIYMSGLSLSFDSTAA